MPEQNKEVLSVTIDRKIKARLQNEFDNVSAFIEDISDRALAARDEAIKDHPSRYYMRLNELEKKIDREKEILEEKKQAYEKQKDRVTKLKNEHTVLKEHMEEQENNPGKTREIDIEGIR